MAQTPQIIYTAKLDERKTLADIQGVMNNVSSALSKRPLNIAIKADAKSLSEINNGLGQISRSSSELNKSIEASNARVVAFGASVGIITAIQQSFSNLVRSTLEVETAFKKIEVVGDQFAKTQAELQKFGRGIFDVARQTGQSFGTAAEASLEFARQGLEAVETLKRTKDALILVRLSGIGATEAVEGLTAATNSFKKEGLDTTEILNKLIAVDNKFAVSSADLIEGIKRSGASAKDAGLSFDELIATITVLQETTARGGSVIGNSLKTILERVRRPESLSQLQQLGVEIKNTEGSTLSAIQIIDNFAKKVSELDDVSKQGALRQLAGTLQINQLSSLVTVLEQADGALNQYQKAQQVSANSSNESAIANAKANETLQVSIDNLLTTAKQFAAGFGANAFSGIAENLNGFTESLTGLSESFSSEGGNVAKAFAKSFGDVLSGPGLLLASGAALAFFAKFVGFAKESFKDLFKLNQESKQQASIQAAVLNILSSRRDIQQQILSLSGDEVAQATVLKKIFSDINRETIAVQGAAQGIAQTFYKSGARVNGSGVPTFGKNDRAASGYVPDLIQAEYKDIQKGVGGANKNSQVVLLNNFPFGGGKKGTMVANTSEGILPMDGGAAVLTKSMMSGKRAADGDVSGLSKEEKKKAREQEKAQKEAAAQKAAQEKRLLKERQRAEKQAITQRESEAAARVREQSRAEARRIKEESDSRAKQQSELKKSQQAQQRAEKLAADQQIKEARKLAAKQAQEAAKLAEFQAKLNKKFANRIPPSQFSSQQLGFGAFGRSSQQQVESQRKRQLGRGAVSQVPGLFDPNQPGFARSSILEAQTKATLQRFESRIGSRRVSQEPVLLPNNLEGPVNVPTRQGESYFQSKKSARQNILSQVPDAFSKAFAPKPLSDSAKKLSDELNSLSGDVQKVKRPFGEFASSTLLSFLAFDAVGSVVGNFAGEFDVAGKKSIEALAKAAFALQAISQIGKEFGGLNISELIPGKGLGKGVIGKLRGGFSIGRAGGALDASASALLAGSRTARIGATIGSLAGGFTKLLPVIGQFSLALFAANGVLQAFGIDVPNLIYKAFGGLSDQTKELQNNFKTLSEQAIKQSKFVGIPASELIAGLQEGQASSDAKIKAEKAGVKTNGKSASDSIQEAQNILIDKALRGLKTGRTFEGLDVSRPFIGGSVGGGFAKKTFEETFAELDQDTQGQIKAYLGQVTKQTQADLQRVASTQLGLSNEQIQSLGLEKLQTLVLQKAAEGVIRSIGNIPTDQKIPINSETSQKFLREQSIRFLAGGQQTLNEKPRNVSSNFILPKIEQTRAELSAALELRKLQLDFNSAKERELTLALKTSQVSDLERAKIQAKLNDLQLERELRNEIFASAKKNIETLANSEEFANQSVVLEGLRESVKEIEKLGGSAEQTFVSLEKIFKELGNNIAGTEILKTLDQEFKNLPKITDERKRQQKITNEDLILETKINEQIRLRKSLIELSGEAARSRLETRKSAVEGQIGILGAQASNPSLSISGQESFRKKEIELQKKSLELDKEIALQNRKNAEALLGQENELNTVSRGKKLFLIEDEFNRTTQAINDQIAALGIQKNQLDAVKSSTTVLSDAILQFGKNLGELEGSNLFDILQSGDFSSLSSGLTRQAAIGDVLSSGRKGADSVSFLAERTALRQKEFEIQSAQTQAQKLQATQELKLLEDILAIKNENIEPEEKIAKLIEAQNKNLKEQRSLRFGSANAVAQLQDETQNFGASFGETAVFGFRDALSEALKAAANNTGDLKSALLDVALSFANRLRDAAIDNLANIATSSLFGGQTTSGSSSGLISSAIGAVGNFFTKRATGGPITGGSGTKDDVPTLLMGGEYVVNKKAVKQYGPEFFNALNSGRVGQMATGGQYIPGMFNQGAIRGGKNLLGFASQNFTSGANDRVSSLSGGAAAVSLEAESLRLTNFARQSDNNPLNQATQDTKEQALSLLFQEQDLIRSYDDAIKAKKKAEKEKYKQLLISLGVAAVGAGVSAYAGSGQGMTKAQLEAAPSTIPANYQPRGVSVRPGQSFTPSVGRNVIRSTSSATNLSPAITRAVTSSSSNLALPVGDANYNVGSYYNNLLPKYRAAGGPVGGDGYGDNTRAMLTGGEFVMNRRAAKNIGLAGLNAANAGQSLGVSEEKSEELNSKLIAKLDELVEKMDSSNNVSVNVTMDKNGQATTSESGTQTEDQRNMNRRIKDAVIQILQEQQRIGGVLRK